MKKSADIPPAGTPEHEAWLRIRAKQREESYRRLEAGQPPFDERGVLSGSHDSITQTDAESFPEELEEYQSHERIRCVPDCKPSHHAKDKP